MSDSFGISRIVAHQAALSIEFPRQEYWSGTTIELSQWLRIKESACNAGDTGDMSSISGSGRSLGERSGNSLQYSGLENSMDRGAWWATVHEVAKSWT